MKVECGHAYRCWPAKKIAFPMESTFPTLWMVSLHGVAINYFVYNFIKIHSTLRVTPAMAAGVTTRLFDVMDLVKLLVESETRAA